MTALCVLAVAVALSLARRHLRTAARVQRLRAGDPHDHRRRP